jgi:cytochrome P450
MLAAPPMFSFAEILRRAAQDEELRSELAREVGIKRYHDREFRDGPYRFMNEPVALDSGGLRGLERSVAPLMHSRSYLAGVRKNPLEMTIPVTMPRRQRHRSGTSHMTFAGIDIFSPEFQEDPYPSYALLRKGAPVYREPRYGVYVLTRFADVDATLRDHETFRSGAGPAPMPMPSDRPGMSMLPLLAATDPPHHDQLRALVSRAFTPRRTAASEPRIRGFAERLVADLPDGEFDLVPGLSVPLPVAVIAEILGVDASYQDDFRRWSDATVGLMDRPPEPAMMQASAELIGFFRAQLEERRKNPQDDMISDLLEAEIDGRRLTEAELDAFFIMLLVAGNETTTNWISNQLDILAGRPDLWKACREDRSLVPLALEETLRFDAPVQNLGRETTRDVEIRGVAIPAGSRVVVSFGAANRDPEIFEAPDAYRLDRGEYRHLAFGQGRHFCLGAGLARMEGRIALEALLDRFEQIEPCAAPSQRLRSTVIRGFDALPLVGRSA